MTNEGQDRIISMGGPKPIDVPSQIWDWAQEYAKHKALCFEYFGGRADYVIDQARLLANETELGAIQSLDVCMQVEAEFPGRVEEFVDRAGLHPQGKVIGLMQYIKYIRTHG